MEHTILNIHEAATFLGRKHQAVRRLVQKGILTAHLDGQAYIFRLKDLEKVKAQAYAEGMTHSDIAAEYHVKRTTVVAAFKRLKVQPGGYNQAKGRASVYSQTTVAKFARILGWDRRHKNPTDGSPLPARVSPESDGEPSHDPPDVGPHADNGDNVGSNSSFPGNRAR